MDKSSSVQNENVYHCRHIKVWRYC